MSEIVCEVTKKDFIRYLKVQDKGHYNMFDPRAKSETGLSDEKYSYILAHYDELEEKFGVNVDNYNA